MRKREALLMSFAELLASRPLLENRCGAYCMTCRKPADSEAIVDQRRGVRNGITVRVCCHGEEEIGIFEFGTQEWDDTDIKRAMQRRRWFDPSEKLGNILNGGRIHG